MARRQWITAATPLRSASDCAFLFRCDIRCQAKAVVEPIEPPAVSVGGVEPVEPIIYEGSRIQLYPALSCERAEVVGESDALHVDLLRHRPLEELRRPVAGA